ncbi:MAG: hypothetical protein SCJ94_01740 [Bacillota bacterium]|nr:hypothetical protein [Bacillota bacterium]
MKRRLLFVLAAMFVVAISLLTVGCGAQESAPAGGQDSSSGETTGLVLPAEEKGIYPDGRYRGTYQDRGMLQISIEFYLQDNKIDDITFRTLAFSGNDFRDAGNPENEWPQMDVENLAGQYGQLLEWLVGKDITEIGVLVDSPEVAASDVEASGEVVAGVDVWTSATMRGTKITSAIRDGLNRGLY